MVSMYNNGNCNNSKTIAAIAEICPDENPGEQNKGSFRANLRRKSGVSFRYDLPQNTRATGFRILSRNTLKRFVALNFIEVTKG